MSILWALAVIVILFVLLIVLLRPPSQTLTVPLVRTLRCPRSGEDVTAEFRVAAWDSRLVDVVRCSAFSPLTCDKLCLGTHRHEAKPS